MGKVVEEKVKNVHKRFGVKHALCEVNIEIRDGETLGYYRFFRNYGKCFIKKI
jgi:ABC-type uncharacterized transport system ATPase subunit